MTDLRDARFEKALNHAPDAHMGPDARTRAAVRAMAVGAVAPSADSVAGWRRLWNASGNSGAPWGAALASVVLASVVTLTWRGQEIPDAKLADAPLAKTPEPTAIGPAPPAMAPPAVVGAETAAPPTRAPTPVPAAATPTPPAMTAPAAAAAAPAQGPMGTPAQERRAEESAPQVLAKRQESAAVDTARPATAHVPALSAPAPAPAPAQAQATMVPPAPPSVAADAAGLSRASPPAAAKSRRASGLASADGVALDGWTQARVTLEGRVSTIARGASERFVSQVRELVLTTRMARVMPGPSLARIELLQDGEVTGTLLVGEATVQWAARRLGSEVVLSGDVPAALVQELLGEIRRLR